MAKGKQAKLVQSGPQDRTAQREPVAIPARCSIGGREDEEVLITDLGRQGCKLHTGAVGVTRAEKLVITLAGCDPIDGSLKWTKGGMLGVRFAQPLGEAELERLCDEESAANVVPLRG